MRRLGVAMPSGAASGIALRGPSKLDAGFLEERKAAEYATLIQVPHSRARHALRRRGARDVGAGGRGLLGLVPIEDALGAVELARHVLGVVADLPGRAPQRACGVSAAASRAPNEAHLHRLLHAYLAYYHGARTHLSLAKDAPDPRPVERLDQGRIVRREPQRELDDWRTRDRTRDGLMMTDRRSLLSSVVIGMVVAGCGVRPAPPPHPFARCQGERTRAGRPDSRSAESGRLALLDEKQLRDEPRSCGSALGNQRNQPDSSSTSPDRVRAGALRIAPVPRIGPEAPT